ncbi:MAG: tRNA U-34 5-methylaminomethyl-2-thiouridine biosynthesis protein [Myxococcales bacterium]|nr:tRNA U-34 5-methylaminomethyl-2-thiouridine biosynthesis protein [Myxococcales bacterium]
MTVVGGFLVPGSPLPLLARANPAWGALASGMEEAGRRMAQLAPDVVVVYSTQWLAVLDQLWQTRSEVSGVHVDETWHEYGDIPYSLRVDTAFASRCIELAGEAGIRSRAVDYDAFPIDTGTLVAAHFLDPGGTAAFGMTSNNLYHDRQTTEGIGVVVRRAAEQADARIVAVGVGGLSGTLHREERAPERDTIAGNGDDAWNRRILGILEKGQVEELAAIWDEYAAAARVDMGFKHLAFVLGALGGTFAGAETLAYGPTYGAGAAVVAFSPD